MRVLFGWLLLFGLVAAMAWITAEKRARARERSAQITAERAPEEPGVPARILIGGLSGVAPTPLPSSDGRPERVLPPASVTTEQEPSIPSPKIFMVDVRPGAALSTMCQEFYKQEGRPPLAEVVEAVARWNQLSSPDSLQVGQSLGLPPLELLFPE